MHLLYNQASFTRQSTSSVEEPVRKDGSSMRLIYFKASTMMFLSSFIVFTVMLTAIILLRFLSFFLAENFLVEFYKRLIGASQNLTFQASSIRSLLVTLTPSKFIDIHFTC